MGSRWNNAALIGLGILAGIAASMQFSALAQKPVEQGLPLEELRQLADVYGLIKSDYVEPVDDRKLLTEAINGMVAALDPHSAYLDQKAYRELREGTEGRFVGLGIEVVSTDDGYVRIIAPIEGSPAERAGLRAGDVITRMDGVSVQGLGLDETVKRMRGEPRTKVALSIVRSGLAQPFDISVMREEIHQRSVKARMVEPGYAWLRIAQFQEPTLEDLVKQMLKLYAENPDLKGLVLDLRNDPGGLVQGAIGVAAAFLPRDVEIVATNGQLAEAKQTFYSRPEFYSLRGEDALARLPAAVKDLPLVVLVNGGTASASEIVAGALQDYKRAAILGSQTFGKGSVQTIRPLLKDTAVKLTTARYYTPSGRAIQAKGIIPDFAVDEWPDGDLNDLRLREADLERHLRGEGGAEPAPARSAAELAAAARLAAARKPVDYGSAADFQLQQALRHLKGQSVQLSRSVAARYGQLERHP
ncbi:S41 family peptidase [Massilia sp. TS11]|uniref:S41 family peptidase n=1 Tax=Massilia sp. TS11 TaxID=2908003 RepID=UPI001ED9D36D|nr:S41 family peptidase [Massilia sp. TS11]MCG2585781.1 S41 family peptidase [Massilia sp. TS11]